MIYVNANIITVNEKFDVIENGAIAVKEDRIVAIGPVDQVVLDFSRGGSM